MDSIQDGTSIQKRSGGFSLKKTKFQEKNETAIQARAMDRKKKKLKLLSQKTLPTKAKTEKQLVDMIAAA